MRFDLSASDYPFQATIFIDHFECVLAALVGAVVAFRQRRFREFLFPGTLFLTAFMVHLFHRPWWTYYYLHLAVPIVWFAGFSVAEAVACANRSLLSSGRTRPGHSIWPATCCCILTAFVLVRSGQRLHAGVLSLKSRPPAAADPMLAKMREYAPRSRWVYTDPGIYAFHAALPTPPELAIITVKRFWSGQISDADIVQTCERYRVDQILLPATGVSQEWDRLLKDHYTLSYETNNLALYLANH